MSVWRCLSAYRRLHRDCDPGQSQKNGRRMQRSGRDIRRVRAKRTLDEDIGDDHEELRHGTRRSGFGLPSEKRSTLIAE